MKNSSKEEFIRLQKMLIKDYYQFLITKKELEYGTAAYAKK